MYFYSHLHIYYYCFSTNMEKNVTIFCKNTKSYHDYPLGTSLIEIYKDLKINLKYQVVAARVNYKVEDLNFLIYNPKDIEFIDLSSPSGMRVYVRSLSMVLSKAISELYPDVILRIEHPISNGYYCKLDNLNEPLTKDVVERIKDRVNLIISQKKRIISEEKQTSEVKELFSNQHLCSKHWEIRIADFSESMILLITIMAFYCLLRITSIFTI